MPLFHINFRNGVGTRADDACILFPDLDNAYLHVCATIPDAAQKILLKGEDPLACAFVIADTAGQTLMDVPFSEVLTRRQAECLTTGRYPGYSDNLTEIRLPAWAHYATEEVA